MAKITGTVKAGARLGFRLSVGQGARETGAEFTCLATPSAGEFSFSLATGDYVMRENGVPRWLIRIPLEAGPFALDEVITRELLPTSGATPVAAAIQQLRSEQGGLVRRTGDRMTGQLLVPAPAKPESAVPRSYVDDLRASLEAAGHFVHVQNSPIAELVISHPLQRFCAVQIYDLAGAEMITVVEHLEPADGSNRVKVSFGSTEGFIAAFN